ncbi:MAG: hypothetical protein LBM98_13570 [Oscillospiraceae bacterium]|nr:hypothetical protein [Oscillospiraceae bacterium]
MRYVGRYRCEAIQCRERNIRLTYRRILRQPWIASPHIINYVSQVRRRLRKDGAPWAHHWQGIALPPQPSSKPSKAPLVRGGKPPAGGGGCPAPCAGGGFQTRPYEPQRTRRSPFTSSS